MAVWVQAPSPPSPGRMERNGRGNGLRSTVGNRVGERPELTGHGAGELRGSANKEKAA